MIKFIDIHSHLNFEDFNLDREEVINRAREKEIAMIDVGCEPKSAQEALSLAQKHEGIWASVGFHPNYVNEKVFDYDFYYNLSSHSKVVAIGECGLDFFHQKDNLSRQAEVFESQIDIANKLRKPLMLHIRKGYREALDILQKKAEIQGNAHFFAGSWEEAKSFFDIGFSISFSGVITFARDYDQIIKNAPLEMIMAETDCPYVAPEPWRGKRNEPSYLLPIVEKIAQIRGEDLEKVRTALLQNAQRVFSIPLL